VPLNDDRTDLARTQTLVAVVCLIAFVLSASAASPLSLQFLPSAELAGELHLLLEFIATAIAVVVVAVSFQSLDRGGGHSASTLIYAFTVVACAGIAHTIVFQGTPVSGEPLAAINSIYFWLIRRFFETGAFCLIAGAVALRGSRIFWICAALLTTVLVIWFAAGWSESLRSLKAPGFGPSRIAHGIDAFFATINLFAALLLWRRGIRRHSRSDSLLAGSCVILGLASFMLVVAPGGVQLPIFMGHALRALAYACLYAAVYLFAIREPHDLLRDSENRLRESREQLKALGDNLPKGAVYQMYATPDGLRRFEYVSEGIKWLNGLTPDAVMRDSGSLYSLILEEDRPALQAAEIRSYRTMGTFHEVLRYRLDDGSIGWIQICSEPRKTMEGRVVWDGVAIDVTARERALAEIKVLNAELEQRVAERTAGLTHANRSLETFSHLVAHDLRAPLRHVEGFSSILKSEYADRLDAEGRRLLDKIIDGGETMSRLIEGMLAVARLEAATLSRGDTDLSALCASICRTLAEADPGRFVRFRIQPGLVDCADRTLIRNVLENLLGNAWRFTSREADALIEFGAVERDGERLYFVRDNGAGFDPKHGDKLFTLFHRLHLAQEFPGTGVGLASVRSVIANHGGRVWAEGAVGKGATLFFTLGSSTSRLQPASPAEAGSLAGGSQGSIPH
jgi:signal transduction histidine kinase